MITKIIELIQCDEWYGVSDNVEIAKGKNQYLTRWGQIFKEIKRIVKWLKK